MPRLGSPANQLRFLGIRARRTSFSLERGHLDSASPTLRRLVVSSIRILLLLDIRFLTWQRLQPSLLPCLSTLSFSPDLIPHDGTRFHSYCHSVDVFIEYDRLREAPCRTPLVCVTTLSVRSLFVRARIDPIMSRVIRLTVAPFKKRLAAAVGPLFHTLFVGVSLQVIISTTPYSSPDRCSCNAASVEARIWCKST